MDGVTGARVDDRAGDHFGTRLSDRFAAAVAIVALVLGLVAIFNWRADIGVGLVRDGQYVRIASVATHSPARREGFEPGMIVLGLNGTDLVNLPQYVEPLDAKDQPLGPPTFEPATPTPVDLDAVDIGFLIGQPIYDLRATQPSNLAGWAPNQSFWTYLGRDYSGDLRETAFGLLAGVLLMIGGIWWLASGRGGRSLRPIAIPLAVATAIPLLIRPLEATWFGDAVAAAGVLAPAGMLPLAIRLSERIEEEEVGRVFRTASLACAAGAVAIGLVRPLVDAQIVAVDWAWNGLVAAIPLVPGLAAAGPIRIRLPMRLGGPAPVASSRRVLQSTELAVAGATPLMAMVTVPYSYGYLFPLSIWLIAIAVAGKFTIRPLARLAMRAQLQRDLIVAATEAERARVAADIHDDALQELTLLVRRLDEAGDTEGAEIARTVSDRLRAICGDLRLPILDDLGVGPALDWLVMRIERLADGEVRLEREDGTRPPPDVELAFFRVAQEALANAVKHGKPPIVVRYRSSESGASLSVDDAGAGIREGAAASAEASGHFGLLNMGQRAEQVGAILDIRRWPKGGTHVALEWRAR